MKARLYLFVLILVGLLLAGAFYQQTADVRANAPLEEAIIGTWKFSQDGYYFGFDEEGQLCYGGSTETVAAKHWCNKYTLEDDIVTETCRGGPEDRNCPLGGGTCKARVSISEDAQLTYRVLHEQCDMLPYKAVPPREYAFTQSER